MAETKSLVTRMTTDTSGFKKGMDEVVEKLNKYNKALVDNQYKQRECNKVINDAKKRIKELNESQKEKGKLDEKEEQELKKLTETIEEEKVKLSQLRTEQASLRNVISETTRSLTDNNDKWTVLKGTLANLASDTIKKLASSLANIARDVVQTGEQFSASMSEVGAISGATAEELSELEQTARLYGSTTKFSATEAANALKYMALAGWNSQQAISGLPAVLDLAAASGMDLGRASDIVTDYITAFGLAAEDSARFVDIMSYAMSHSNTTTEMLGEAYKNCAATAKSMGFSVEEVTAALMTMANAGVKGGEAGTTLNTLMTRLATNTKGCADELSKYGVKIYDSEGKMHSLSEIMSGLISVFQSLNQQQQANLSKMIAGTNQYSGFQTLMQGMSDAAKAAGMSFEDYTAALKECDGASSDMAKTMSDNLSGDLKALQSAFDELKLKLYDDAEIPLRNLVKLAKDGVVPAIDGIIKHLKDILPYIVGASTALATLKLNLSVGKIVAEITKDTEAFKKALQGLTVATQAETVAQEQLNIAMKANVIGLVITAVVSLTSAIGTLVAMNQDNSNSFENSNTKAKNYLGTLQNLKAEADKRIEDVQAEGKALQDLQNEYDNLRKQTNLTADEKSRLDTVANELAKTLGISTQALKDKNGAYIEITGSVDEYIKKLQEQAVLENASDGIKESYLAYNKAKKAVQDYNKQIQEQQEIVDDNAKHVENLQKHLDEDFPIHNFYYYGALNELNDAKKELESQKSILNDLKGVQAGYQTQMITATGSAIEYKKALGQVVDEEKEWEQCGKDMNSTAEETAKTFSKLNQAENDNTEVTETATKKTETLSEKYKRLNGLLEENQKAIKSVNYEIEQAMDSGDAEHLKELQDKLKDLNSENTTLQSRIKAVKDEIEKDANAIADAIENVENSMQMLQKAEKEVTDNGKLSLNTLNSIQKKYPELIDLTNQYIEGVKTEKDVIEGLKAAYENDKTAFANAIAAKKLLSQNYNQDFINNTINLFNEICDKYDIDVTNFKNAADAKQAINDKLYNEMLKKQAEYDKLFVDKNYQVIHNNDRGSADYKEFEYFKYDILSDSWRAATDKEIEYYNKVQQDYFHAVDNYHDFINISAFDDVYNAYLSGRKSADNLYKFIDTEIKTSADNSKSTSTTTKQDDKKQVDEYQEKLNLAKAAYEKLVNGKIELLQKEAQAAKDTANAEIAALDRVLAKRKQARTEEDRQKKLDYIKAQLRYKQLDDFSRKELQRQKQDLLSEQADYLFEQNISAKKDNINFRLDLAQNKSQQAINGLNSAKSQFADHIAYLSGNQTYDQRVANNTTNQNVQIIQNGLNGDQVVAKLLKVLGAV